MCNFLKENFNHFVVALALALLVVICVGGVTVTVVSPDGPTPNPTPAPTPDPDQPDPPTPNPGPTPNPTPPTPPPPDPGPIDGSFGIARLVWKSAKDVQRPDECRALASAFKDLAEYVRENEPGKMTIIGVPGIKEGLVQKYVARAIPPASRPAWSAFGAVVESAVKESYNARKLRNSADWANLFDEIATGLEAVR